MSPATKPTTIIDDLPPEMICELFEYLHPKDLAACSLVNRRWHSIYAAFKLHSLIVIESSDYNFVKWFNSNQPILVTDRCSLAIFRHLAEKPLLSNLKHLALWGLKLEFDLNELNRFEKLVHLEIETLFSDKKVNLNMLRLKVLAIHHFNENCPLTVDCPELHTLLYVKEKEGANLLDVKHPETIKKLDTDLVGWKLDQFRNVESLETWEFKAISKATLLSLPKLTELRFNQNIESFFWNQSRNGLGSVDRMKRTVSEFMGEAKRLRGRDLQFTFCGFQLTNVDVNQIDFGVQVDERTGREWVPNEYVYLKNYHLIEPDALPFVSEVDYTRLLSSVTGEFPLCFSQKFTGINWVQTTAEVQDADHLLWFLKSLRFLRSLYLETKGLSQEFYDQLPAAARSLTNLLLRGEHCEDGLQLNFDFLSKFSHLLDLEIRPALSLEATTSLVRSLGRIREGTFYVDGTIKCKLVRSKESIRIVKERRSVEWKIYEANQLRIATENPDEIVKFFEELRTTQL